MANARNCLVLFRLARAVRGSQRKRQESARCIGPEKFRDWVEEQHAMLLSSRRCPEDVAFRRLPDRWVESDEVLEAVAKLSGSDVDSILTRRRGQAWKGIAALLLLKHAGLTRRDVARVLGLRGGSGVSYQIKLAEQAMANDSRLANRIKRLEKKWQ